MKESRSTTRRPLPGPAPARHARPSAWPSTRSSWRTCPNVNERRNVPSVEGAIGRCPSTASVRPARNRSQSSIESAPSSIACTSEITLRPGRAAPGRPPSLTAPSTRASIPSRRPSVTASMIPAPATTRSSSNTTSDRSDRSCTMRVTSWRRPQSPQTTAFCLLRRSFHFRARTEPSVQTVDRG